MSLVRWFVGVILWVAAIGERILFWGLRNWAYFVATPCIGLLVLTKWVAFTLSKQIQGLHLSILGYVPGHHVNPVLSYGCIAALLIAVAGVTYSRRHWRSLAVTGLLIVALAFFALLQTAFLHPGLLKELTEEEIEAKAAADFSKRYLPTNTGSEPSDTIGLKGLPADTVWQRFAASWYFMGFGWYVAVVCGLSAFLYGICRTLRTIDRLRIAGVMLCLIGALAVACAIRPSLAHLAFVRGQEAESKGDLAKAIKNYREAIRLDSWYSINPDIYQRIGAIDQLFGRLDTFEYGIYYAELMISENNYPAAIAEYEKLVTTAGPRSHFLKTRLFEIWNSYGIELYAAGAIGAACGAWQSVLELAPHHWLAVFCLSKAYFDTGRYQEAIDLIQELVKGLADPELRANLHSNMGDAYTRLGDYYHAHLAYRYSYFVDNILNWRALTSLVGS
jgi:tetratricopeptide (TPR) repeat protein